MADHRKDCQLYTVPVYGLCTCDFDERMAIAEAKAWAAQPFKWGAMTNRERDEATRRACT